MIFRKTDTQDRWIPKHLALTEKLVREIFKNCDDVVYRSVIIGNSKQEALLVFVSDLVKKDLVDAVILRQLLNGLHGKRIISIEDIRRHLISASDIRLVNSIDQVEQSIVSGDVVIFLDENSQALSMGALGWEHRGVEKTENEVSVRGSQQAFTENMLNNIALVRRFLLTSRLKIERHIIGEVTRTPYAIVYIEDIADPAVISEVKDRIKKRRVEKIFDSGYIEEIIRDAPWSPFPTVNYTERPDRVVAQLLEGRIAIFVENSPNVLTVPAVFAEFMQVPEDYYGNFLLQSAIRILRYFGFGISLILPSLYVAIVGFHHELIPGSFLPSLMQQRQGVPLPTVVEVGVMEIMFEILREAGLRLPRPIGQAISIVGALVIGQAAVQAKLVMASTVIVVAMTGIASFTAPGFGMAGGIRLLRFPLLMFTGLLGILGLTLGIMLTLFHLTTLRSFGVIYTGGISPRTSRDWKDTFLRVPEQTESNTPWIGKKER